MYWEKDENKQKEATFVQYFKCYINKFLYLKLCSIQKVNGTSKETFSTSMMALMSPAPMLSSLVTFYKK